MVGRAPLCAVRASDPRVSNEHACLRWQQKAWSIRDLTSTNGTWVNGQRIASGTNVPLVAGDRLAFGDRALEWEFCDDSAPGPMVVPVAGGDACMIADGVIAVPNAEAATATIFRGADGTWTLETSDRVKSIVAGEVFAVLGQDFRFSCPNEWEATTKTRSLRLVHESTLYFDVSKDEDHVALTVETDGEMVQMGELSIFYLLLTLARIRKREQEQHSPRECGWVHRENLMDMLRCGEQKLNLWVHRIRAKFSEKDFLDYARVIERRDGSGQLRIGVSRLVLEPADTVESNAPQARQ